MLIEDKNWIDSKKIIVFKADQTGNFIFLNKAWENYFGYSLEESLGKSCFSFFDHSSVLQINNNFEKLVNNEKDSCELDCKVMTKLNGFIAVKVKAYKVFEKHKLNTNVVGTMFVLDNSTNVNLMDRSSQNFSQLLDHDLREVHFLMSANLDKLDFISEAIEDYGLDRKEMISNRYAWKNYVPEEDWDVVLTHLTLLKKNGRSTFVCRTNTSKGMLWIAVRMWRSLSSDSSTDSVYQGNFLDVTENIIQGISLQKTEIRTQELSDILQIISEAQLSLFTNKDYKHILKSMLNKLIKLTGDQLGFICEVIEDDYGQRKMLPHAFAMADDDAYIKEYHKPDMSFSNYDSLYGHVLRSGETYISNDARNDKSKMGTPLGHPSIRSFIGIPIWKNHEFLGLIGLANRKDPYSLDDIEFLSPILFSYGNLIKFSRILEEQRKLENEKVLAQDRFKLLEQNISDIICLINKDMVFEYVSPSVIHIIGYSPEFFLGRKVEFVLSEIASTQKRYEKSNGIYKNIVTVIHPFTGKNIQLETISKVVTDHQNNLFQIISTARDVSDKEEMYQKIEQALWKEKELNSLKSRFISMTSHEFRTPLSIILSSSELLNYFLSEISDPKLSNKMNHHVQRINDQVKRLTSVIEDVLIIEKHENKNIRINLEMIDLRDFILNLKFDFDQNNVSARALIFHFPNENRYANSDPAKLRHILGNLIENAFKYSFDDSPKPEVSLNYMSDYFCLSVKDYGIGIPEPDQPRIFESFFRGSNTTSIKGTGLGLNIVHELVMAMNGKITFESQENKGTLFEIKLPYNFD
ncbi:ATP-binding protein [Belliella kenyensis]|uniref:histidine kinase n=1 Tax=Belliella kenyensis TaxID=1472724 RepID=A0ABV8EKI5_9BACT|nr:ATP-binding protein [Belliella kenyensis]MCH7400521.1 ATP-binding protein [Belliella kenyensis]MDN3604463.1 ATP-binding protein [Belliella kenyensis]